jgi:hypothetical protein
MQLAIIVSRMIVLQIVSWWMHYYCSNFMASTRSMLALRDTDDSLCDSSIKFSDAVIQ